MQDLFLDVLGSTATKREAKAYLSRFGPNKTALQASNTSSTNTKKLEVNLGNLYGSSRAVDERSVFSHTPDQPNFVDEPVDVLRVALIKIRAPQSIQDETLPCIGHTLSQLSKLGLSCVVVVDVEDEQERTDSENYESAIKQADRLVEAIDIHAGQGARTLDNVIGVSSVNERLLPSVKVHSEVHIMQKSLLLAPLRRGITPVIAPVGFVLDTQRRIPVIGDEVILALTREFAGIQIDALAEDDDQQILDKITSLQKQISVDHRIAGVITAGEYEGGAILTWETPHGFSPSDPQHMVPYLDKFAVLKRSQGAGGVADIVFKAMVRDCFPNGVCWRSRANNPVNKWYFERAKGTWKMPGTNWTMFWTTEGVERGDDVFLDYEAVCKAVLPTWADQNIVVD
ncbi:hypothetical protein P7C71_g1114, partial [Lecanoromycetidae sp. Uapishka_2]